MSESVLGYFASRLPSDTFLTYDGQPVRITSYAQTEAIYRRELVKFPLPSGVSFSDAVADGGGEVPSDILDTDSLQFQRDGRQLLFPITSFVQYARKKIGQIMGAEAGLVSVSPQDRVALLHNSLLTSISFPTFVTAIKDQLDATGGTGAANQAYTVAEAGTMVAGDTQVLAIVGIETRGDAPDTYYFRASAEPAHPAKIQTADGVWFQVSQQELDVRYFGAKPDGTGDTSPALSAALTYASGLAAYGQRKTVLVPAGNYRLLSSVDVPSNVRLIVEGVLTYAGPASATGKSVLEVHASSNVEITGGVVDAGNVRGVGGISVNADGASSALIQNVWIHHLQIRNVTNGGSSIAAPENPATLLSNRGGRGLQIRYGVSGVLVHDIVIDDAAIGMSLEGLPANQNTVTGVAISNVIVRRAKFIGLYASSNAASGAASVDVLSAILDNIQFIDCSLGMNGYDSREIAADFGVITLDSASGLKVRASIVGSTGRLSAIRGSHRYCSFDLDVDATAGASLISVKKHGGTTTDAAGSKSNEYSILYHLRTVAPTGYLVEGSATQKLSSSSLDIRFMIDPGTPEVGGGDYDGPDLFLNLGTNVGYTIRNLGNGTSATGDETLLPAKAMPRMQLAGFTLSYDAAKSFAVLSSVRQISLRNPQGLSLIETMPSGLKLPGFKFDDRPLTLGGLRVWQDAEGRIRVSTSAPATDHDGGVIQISSQNGTSAQRPENPVNGEAFLDMSIGRPIWFNASTGKWTDYAGNDPDAPSGGGDNNDPGAGGMSTDTILNTNGTEFPLFTSALSSSSGAMLAQVTFRDGAQGTVDIGGRLTVDHEIVSQKQVESDDVFALVFCPLVYATLTDFNGTGSILVTVHAV